MNSISTILINQIFHFLTYFFLLLKWILIFIKEISIFSCTQSLCNLRFPFCIFIITYFLIKPSFSKTQFQFLTLSNGIIRLSKLVFKLPHALFHFPNKIKLLQVHIIINTLLIILFFFLNLFFRILKLISQCSNYQIQQIKITYENTNPIKNKNTKRMSLLRNIHQLTPSFQRYNLIHH